MFGLVQCLIGVGILFVLVCVGIQQVGFDVDQVYMWCIVVVFEQVVYCIEDEFGSVLYDFVVVMVQYQVEFVVVELVGQVLFVSY